MQHQRLVLNLWRLIRLLNLVRAVASERGRNDKGSQHCKGKKLDNNQCSYCLKLGLWRRDYNNFKEDQKNNRVRQIEEVTDSGSQGSSQAPTSSTTAPTVGLVSFQPVLEDQPMVRDDSLRFDFVSWG